MKWRVYFEEDQSVHAHDMNLSMSQGRLLGRGAYGAVHVALLENGCQIAVKRVDIRPKQGGE